MAGESQICKDWASEFPFLARFKNGRKLLRIQSPVVFGIELEKFFSDKYRPKFIAMNLLSSFPEFSIGRLLRTKKGMDLSIAYSEHERDFQQAVGIMKGTFPFLLGNGEPGEQLLFDVYRTEIQEILEISASPLAVWLSLIQLLKFFGRGTEALTAEAGLRSYAKTLSPPSLATYGDFNAFIERELHVTHGEFEERRRANAAKGGWDVLPGA